MGLVAVPKGSVNCPAGQCACCAPASRLGPAGGLCAGSLGTLRSPAPWPSVSGCTGSGGLETLGQGQPGEPWLIFSPRSTQGSRRPCWGVAELGALPAADREERMSW